MGNADPRIPLTLPPFHRQFAHSRSPTDIQGQPGRSEHLARLADLQEPSLLVDNRGGLLHRVGSLHTALLHLLVRSCQGCFPRSQLSTSRHPQRRVLLRAMGPGVYGRSVRTVQYDDHHSGFMPHLRPRGVAHRRAGRREQGYCPADHLLRLLRLRLGKQHLSYPGLRGTIVRHRSVWKMVRGALHGRKLRLLDRRADCGAAAGFKGRQL